MIGPHLPEMAAKGVQRVCKVWEVWVWVPQIVTWLGRQMAEIGVCLLEGLEGQLLKVAAADWRSAAGLRQVPSELISKI